MALRDTITKWHAAICLLETKKYGEASEKLQEITKPTAKIIYNLGCISMLGTDSYVDAIQCFNRSTDQDKYLALAYYQRGICYHEVKRYDRAELDFLTAQSMTPGDGIDYKQLGAQVMLTSQLLDQCVAITRDSHHSGQHKPLPRLPLLSCIFRPPKAMVDNLVKHNFLERAQVISSTMQTDIIYAAGKKQEQADDNSSGSSSLPSSPLSPRRHSDMSRASKLFIPPPPRRPPPRLSKDTLAIQEFRTKSKSCEDMSSDDHIYEDIDEDPDVQPLPQASAESSSRLVTTNITNDGGHRTFSSHIQAPSIHSGHSTEQNAQHNPNKVFPQQSFNHVKMLSSSSSSSSPPQQGYCLADSMDKSFQRLTVNDSGPKKNPGLQVKEQFSSGGNGQFGSNKVPPNLFGAGSNHHSNSGQGQVVGHIAQMRSLFERNDSSRSAPPTQQIKAGAMKLPHQNDVRRSSTQTAVLSTSRTKPARPPPPKFQK